MAGLTVAELREVVFASVQARIEAFRATTTSIAASRKKPEGGGGATTDGDGQAEMREVQCETDPAVAAAPATPASAGGKTAGGAAADTGAGAPATADDVVRSLLTAGGETAVTPTVSSTTGAAYAANGLASDEETKSSSEAPVESLSKGRISSSSPSCSSSFSVLWPGVSWDWAIPVHTDAAVSMAAILTGEGGGDSGGSEEADAEDHARVQAAELAAAARRIEALQGMTRRGTDDYVFRAVPFGGRAAGGGDDGSHESWLCEDGADISDAFEAVIEAASSTIEANTATTPFGRPGGTRSCGVGAAAAGARGSRGDSDGGRSRIVASSSSSSSSSSTSSARTSSGGKSRGSPAPSFDVDGADRCVPRRSPLDAAAADTLTLEMLTTNMMPAPPITVALLNPRQMPSATSNKMYTQYQLSCTQGRLRWTVRRRYREFHALHKAAHKAHAAYRRDLPGGTSSYRGPALPPLPTKKNFGNLKKNFVETRRAGLQAYMRHLLQLPWALQSIDVLSFLGLVSTTRQETMSTGRDVVHITMLKDYVK